MGSPEMCAGQMVADVIQSLLEYVPFMEAGTAGAAAGPALALTTPFMLCGDSACAGADTTIVRIDPNKPARDVVPGSLRPEFPGEHWDKSLNEIKELLRKAGGKEKNSLQKAKKILEQADRLLGKNKG